MKRAHPSGTNNACKLWCWTINNPVESKETLLGRLQSHCSYIVIGDEVGESGTPHFQGYFELLKKARFNAVKLLFDPSIPHLEAKSRNSTRDQAAEYCKKDSNYVEYGTLGGQGKKKRKLAILANAVIEGEPLSEVAQLDPETYIRNYRGLQDFQAKVTKISNFRPVKTILFYGNTDTGKTHDAFADFPDLYRVPLQRKGNLWFNGYERQKTIFFDEFVGQIPLTNMLQILDKFKLQVETKGGYCFLQNDTFILASNVHPAFWYSSWEGRTEHQKAFIRRIHQVVWYEGKYPEVKKTTIDESDQIFDFCTTPPNFAQLTNVIQDE